MPLYVKNNGKAVSVLRGSRLRTFSSHSQVCFWRWNHIGLEPKDVFCFEFVDLVNRQNKVMTMSLPEEDLTCPICCDIFTDPVLLSCSHSFCRGCLKRCWDSGIRECPVCRKKASKTNIPSNLALKNVCEAFMLVKRQSSLLDEKLNCSLHGEKLKLFCLDDQQPICVVCQTSKLHKTHSYSPVDEAVQDCKVRETNKTKCLSVTQSKQPAEVMEV